MSVGTEGSGPNPRTYSRADYAALEAENARLLAANLDCVAHFEQMRAQLAAMQGGMGEAEKHEAQPEVAENTGSHAMATNQLPRQEQAVARDVEGVAAPCEASPGDDIFAWATFDGEGSYDLRLFDGNESYRDDFRRNNPKHHPDWVFPLYRNSITAAMAAEVERWERSFRDIHEPALRDAHAYIQELRADLAAYKAISPYRIRRLKAVTKERDALHAEAEELRAENGRLADALDRQSVITGDYIARCQRLADELAITRRVIDRIGQLCTTPHESKERFIRRVQSVIEWQTSAQQDQPK